jgi:hypothetical protein
MNGFRSLFLTISCLFVALACTAQKKGNHLTRTKTAYYYSFSGASSLTAVSQLSDSIYAIPGVTEFKPRYKPESGQAEIMVVVVEKRSGPESRPQFNAINVKKIIGEYGFDFMNMTIRDIEH